MNAAEGERSETCHHGSVLRASDSALGSTLWALGVLTCMLCLAACGDATPSTRAPDVILIVVDTLRVDAVGSYGATRDTTPALDGFADDAVRFDRAYATAPWTQPSVASILTGVLPSRHGLTRIGALPESLETLPERLAAADYVRIGIVSHVLLARRQGFDQGFDRFLVSAALPHHEAISTDAVTDRATEVLRAIAASPAGRRPVFLFIHYFDPHYVYHAHDAYGWSAERQKGQLSGSESIEVLRAMSADMTDTERAYIRALYHEEVRYTDAGIGRLLVSLDAYGLADDTLVIITADHGEELLERGWLGHTRTLHEEVVRVPLLARPPGVRRAGRVHEGPVSLTSITPTVLDYAGLLDEAAPERGRSLRPVLEARASATGTGVDDAVVIEVDFVGDDARNAEKNTHAKAIVLGDEKLIRNDETGDVALYDLSSDPGETRDLASERPGRVAALVEMLDTRLAAARSAGHVTPVVAPDAGLREQLRALGYLEGAPDAPVPR